MFLGEDIARQLPQYKNYKSWLSGAKDNEQFVYYKGKNLSENNISFLLGRIVMQDALKGEVLLFQRRNKDSYDYPFDYIAIRKFNTPKFLVPCKLTELVKEH